MSSHNLLKEEPVQAISADMVAVANKQRTQDFFFHRITQAFSLIVLVALLGIIISFYATSFAAPVRKPTSYLLFLA
jgi:phosphate transport system permease protein